MRARLTVAILLLVAVTLIVTTVSSYVLIRHTAVSTAQQELRGQTLAVAETLSAAPDITRAKFDRELALDASAGSFASVTVLALEPDGVVKGTVPTGITVADLDIPQLQDGRQVTGHTSGLLVYSAVPTPITRIRKYTPVLVITRQAHNPANGVRYFVVVGAIGLAIAALVAAALARRFTRPLVAAASVTRRIATGDLDATVEVSPHEIPEFAQLADSINAMGANLVRARDQERQFLLSVSHELRTPLTSIRGYAEAVIDGATDDPVAAASVISSEARRLDRLVQDLLDLARLDADRFSLNLEPVDCAEVVRRVATGFRPRSVELGLELLAAPGSEQPLWVQADSDRLSQVVANLVENASSFAEGRIVVGAGSVGGTPTVWVTDDGPGIPTNQLSKVFERHFISDRVSGRRTGSGLGLAIVSELAAGMGAVVRAESPVAEGHGTRIVVLFQARLPDPDQPLGPSPAPPAPPLPAAPPPAAPSPVFPSPRTVPAAPASPVPSVPSAASLLDPIPPNPSFPPNRSTAGGPAGRSSGDPVPGRTVDPEPEARRGAGPANTRAEETRTDE
jgi:two-component system sensor histidine kinase BaeS